MDKSKQMNPKIKIFLGIACRVLLFVVFAFLVAYLIQSCMISYVSADEIPDVSHSSSYEPGFISFCAESDWILEEGNYLYLSIPSSFASRAPVNIMVIKNQWGNDPFTSQNVIQYDFLDYTIENFSESSGYYYELYFDDGVPVLSPNVYVYLIYFVENMSVAKTAFNNTYFDTLTKYYYQRGTTSGLAYENGYNAGMEDATISASSSIADAYNQGYDVGASNAVAYYVENTLPLKESAAYNAGSNAAITSSNNLSKGIMTLASVPVNVLYSAFNFEILGVNFYYLITSLITLFIVIFIMKKVGVVG